MTYKPITVVVGKDIEFIYCENCGVLVFDAAAHDKWHSSYSEVAKSAHQADIFTKRY